MTVYKLIKDSITGNAKSVFRNDGWFIPFDQANTDYQKFKKQINADEAQLEEVDGNIMSIQEAKAFVFTLP